MSLPLTVLLGSVALFAAFSAVVQVEQGRGRRLFLSRGRAALDRGLLSVYKRIGVALDHFVHFVVKLGWYYSIHSFLRTTMNMLVSLYEYLEYKFEKNRERAAVLHRRRREQAKGTHLSQVAAHKHEVALTPEQEAELKAASLESQD